MSADAAVRIRTEGPPHILGEEGRLALRRLARGQGLLAFDFDGTLAPIARRPESVRIRPRTRELLAAAARLYPCAVISGRGLADLRRVLDGLDLAALAGSHGAESSWTSALPVQVRVGDWAVSLRSRLRGQAGVVVERKPFGVALHYREATDRAAARAAILRLVADIPSVRVMAGKQVVEIVAAGAPTKAHALAEIRRRVQAETALYAGDDVTDEDAFREGDRDHLVSVRVGAGRASAAAFMLPSQRDMDALLAELIALRARGTRR